MLVMWAYAMSDQLRYLGPISGKAAANRRGWSALRKRISLPFILVVVLPSLVAILYWGLIATPRYVSEAHFVVRKTNEARPNNLGLVLQSAGLSAGVGDAFAIQEYIVSRDAAQALHRQFDLEKVFTKNGADIFSRYPGLFVTPSNEARYKALKRYVSISYNGGSGITTLRVQAFAPEDARAMSLALLASGEDLVNRLNERSATDAIDAAQRAVVEATERRAAIERQMVAFRNRERFIDPQLAAAESTQVISSLLSSLAQLKADYAQTRAASPQSPQLPILQGRIAAYEAQVAEARTKIAGEADSLAPKISTYEGLVLQGELANRALMEASAGLLTAQQDARRQKLYLDRIVEPNQADKPTQPQRWRAILIVFLTSMAIYLLGRLLWAGLREHRQE